MPRRSPDYVPAYRLHKQSGQAIVTLSYRDHTLGKYGTADSRAKYHDLIARWIKNGRQPLDPIALPATSTAPPPLTINSLCEAFDRFALNYYRNGNGQETSEPTNIRRACAILRELFGGSPAADFSPLKLKTVRDRMVIHGRSRTGINRDINRIKRVFSWAVSEEYVGASVLVGIKTVRALGRGRSDARESDPVRPVPAELIDAVKPFCSSPIRALIELQVLTGCRPGELLTLRASDLDRSGEVWTFSPAQHKTAHHGHQRVIHFGPRARAVLAPFLDGRPTELPLFSPREAYAECRARKATKGKPRRPGQKANACRTERRRGDAYQTTSYWRAIARACDEANAAAINRVRDSGGTVADGVRLVERFHPHRLRHSAATELRKRFGIEAAKTLLGHESLTATQIYAEKDLAAAARIAAEVG